MPAFGSRRSGSCAVAAVLIAAVSLPALGVEFDSWLGELRQEALDRGVSRATVDLALGDVEVIPRVIELDRRQPESRLGFSEYLARVVPERRVRLGRKKLAEHRLLLEEVRDRYGVQPRFVVALWGIETDFGRITGGYPVVSALATLAYDGRRSSYFRSELFNALQILDEGHIAPAAMTGSWAGAMGQPQFMPSSFRRFAVDQDGDGRRDIWSTQADVFASAANYLARSGWQGDRTWGREVRLPEGFDATLIDLDVVKPLQDWQALGVRRANGRDLPAADLKSSLVRPGGGNGPVFVVYQNFRTLLKWNRSTYFATSVGLLADRIAAGS